MTNSPLREFWAFTGEQARFWKWIVGAAAAFPLVDMVAIIGPSWPNRLMVALISSIASAFAAMFAFAFVRRGSKWMIKWSMIVGLAVTVIALFAYIWLHAQFFYTTPKWNDVRIGGITYLSDVAEVSQVNQWSETQVFENFEHDPDRVWARRGLTVVRLASFWSWLLAFGGLSWTVVSFISLNWPGKQVRKRQDSRNSNQPSTTTEIDVAVEQRTRKAVIITALPIEREAVLEHLIAVQEQPALRGSIYHLGIFEDRSGRWEVIVAEIGAGNVGAAAEAERVIGHYTPEVSLFVGVAGAIKDLSHGDVVASTRVYAYESGKEGEDGFRTRPGGQLTAYALEQRARYEAGKVEWRQRIRRGGTASHAVVPNARVAPIAAGEKVVASNRSATYRFIRQHYNDAVAVEMEGYGFLLSVSMNHPTLGIVVRGISDLVNDKGDKNDETWQPIAARHAAAFAFQLLAKLEAAGESSSHATPPIASNSGQKFIIGDVSGDNNTFVVNQQQGLSLDAIAQLIQGSSRDSHAEIDAACEHMKAAELDIAIHELEELLPPVG